MQDRDLDAPNLDTVREPHRRPRLFLEDDPPRNVEDDASMRVSPSVTNRSLIMIAGGIWGLFDLFRQTVRIPLRYYAIVIGMICGGFAMAGLAQALRLLLVIVTR